MHEHELNHINDNNSGNRWVTADPDKRKKTRGGASERRSFALTDSSIRRGLAPAGAASVRPGAVRSSFVISAGSTRGSC